MGPPCIFTARLYKATRETSQKISLGGLNTGAESMRNYSLEVTISSIPGTFHRELFITNQPHLPLLPLSSILLHDPNPDLQSRHSASPLQISHDRRHHLGTRPVSTGPWAPCASTLFQPRVLYEQTPLLKEPLEDPPVRKMPTEWVATPHSSCSRNSASGSKSSRQGQRCN